MKLRQIESNCTGAPSLAVRPYVERGGGQHVLGNLDPELLLEGSRIRLALLPSLGLECAPRRLEVRAPVSPVRLEVGSFGPLVPAVDEDQAVLRRFVLSPLDRGAQPALV